MWTREEKIFLLDIQLDGATVLKYGTEMHIGFMDFSRLNNLVQLMTE